MSGTTSAILPVLSQIGSDTLSVIVPSYYDINDLRTIYSYTLYSNVAGPQGITYSSGIGEGIVWGGGRGGGTYLRFPYSLSSIPTQAFGGPGLFGGLYLRLVVPHTGVSAPSYSHVNDDCTYRAENGYAANELQLVFHTGDAQWM